MAFNKLNIYFLMLCIMAFSCGPKKGIVTKDNKNKTSKVVVSQTDKNSSKEDSSAESVVDETIKKPISSTAQYIAAYAEIAMAEMRSSKIPASITLAQGILESGSGKGRLAVKANNHFGIKCHGWKGAKIYHDDDRLQECFRKYQYAATSYKDHSEFLTGRKRYASLFKLKPNDYKAWARGLKKAGYATDPKYPVKLISLIERYQLYKYDNAVLENTTPKLEKVRVNSGVVRYIVERGDTLYALAKRFNTTVEIIKRLNKMTSSHLSLGQEIMIPK